MKSNSTTKLSAKSPPRRLQAFVVELIQYGNFVIFVTLLLSFESCNRSCISVKIGWG